VNVGKTLGYLLLALVDALLLPVLIVGIGFLLVPRGVREVAAPYLLACGVLSFAGALIAALICVRRGGKPFPVTRGTKRLADWALIWVP